MKKLTVAIAVLLAAVAVFITVPVFTADADGRYFALTVEIDGDDIRGTEKKDSALYTFIGKLSEYGIHATFFINCGDIAYDGDFIAACALIRSSGYDCGVTAREAGDDTYKYMKLAANAVTNLVLTDGKETLPVGMTGVIPGITVTNPEEILNLKNGRMDGIICLGLTVENAASTAEALNALKNSGVTIGNISATGGISLPRIEE